MQPIRFIMVGGFLGAGKTTAIGRLARHYTDSGLKVAVVTNDQAFGLVDTMSLKAQGFAVGEVPGACFCCKFDDLISVSASLREDQIPDVIITEPVGSCTDLVATVIEPLRHLHGDEYEIAPLAVLLKPGHGLKILRDESGQGFSPKAAYIFLKQLEEADVIVINKVDKLDAERREELGSLIKSRFPGRTVIEHSSQNGEGFDSLVEALAGERRPTVEYMDVDYDIYAEGEAELGWLNASYKLTANGDGMLAINAVAKQFVAICRDLMKQADVEPAHLKTLAEAADGTAALANLVGSDVDVELSVSNESQANEVELTVNARVATGPGNLSTIVDQAVGKLSQELACTSVEVSKQSFRPGRPTPTHRMGASE